MDKLQNLLLVPLVFSGEYSSMDYSCDEQVNECLMKMYFFMLHDEIHSMTADELFDDFYKCNQKLNTKQQDYVKQDFINIINAQDENEKRKVKKKGNE